MQQVTLGEHVRLLRRRKHWSLQDLANATGLSVSHLSRIETDAAVPNPDTVVKLAKSLEGNLEQMLNLARCLPQEILDRLMRRARGDSPALRRGAGPLRLDPTYERALLEDLDPTVRQALAAHFKLSDADLDGLVNVLRQIGRMEPAHRQSFIQIIADAAKGTLG